MLGDILRGHEKSQLVVIEDTCDWPGRHLIISFVRCLALRVDKVILVTFEKPAEYFENCLSAQIKSKVDIVDCSEDPLGWKRGGSASIDGQLVDIVKGDVGGGRKVGVVIDSLLFHILHRPPSFTCQMLHTLRTAKLKDCEVVQCVCLVHQDVHEDSAVGLLEHVATSVIRTNHSRSLDFKHACSILHQRPTGKVTKINENFNMDDSFDVNEVSEAKPVFTMTKPDVQQTQSDPTANLTFKLSLSEQEKQARSEITLPYVQAQGERSDSSSQSGGKISYQPDEVDDFDEEDPDDDLDF